MTEATDLSTSPSSSHQYIGRFAPSPSGPLHMGSLVAALASFLDARSQNGLWLVRMEDLDPPRESQEAADQILKALEQCHLHWDDSVLYQSQRYSAYQEAIATLEINNLVFACTCSRQQIQEAGGIYPGTCRSQYHPINGAALRCKVSNACITFMDRIQGKQSQNLEMNIGDFVIKRKDGLYAYQLAVVVDDAFQGITHVVRGIDLMDSTARQIYLQQQLQLPTPVYAHIPVIVNSLGQKLSKQHGAAPVDTVQPSRLLFTCLNYLAQDPEPGLARANPADILDWGIHHWNPDKLSQTAELAEK